MEFCPKCGAVLVQKTKNAGCPRCNYSLKGKVKLSSSEKIENRSNIAIVREKDSETYPIVSGICVECGNGKAYFWTLQTRSGDEAETKFFKCTKCSAIRRDYS